MPKSVDQKETHYQNLRKGLTVEISLNRSFHQNEGLYIEFGILDLQIQLGTDFLAFSKKDSDNWNLAEAIESQFELNNCCSSPARVFGNHTDHPHEEG